MFLDIFALVVIALLIAVVIWLVVLLGSMPGKIARERNHPQADAVTTMRAYLNFLHHSAMAVRIAGEILQSKRGTTAMLHQRIDEADLALSRISRVRSRCLDAARRVSG